MIKAPKWCSHAIPTARGWEDPNTGEVFASSKFTPEQISDFYGYGDIEEVSTAQVVEMPSFLTEAPVANRSLDEMTKVELEALGRQNGIELDRREKKSTLVERMSDLLKD
jgi:hypothetical protein